MSERDWTVPIQPIIIIIGSSLVGVTNSQQSSSYKIINRDKQEMALGKQKLMG